MVWNQAIDPVIFELPGFQLRFYGLIAAVALLFAFHIIKTEVGRTKFRVSISDMLDMTILSILAGLIGARAYYVLCNLEYYFKPDTKPEEVLFIWQGGMGSYGGLLFGGLVLLAICKFKNLRFVLLADIIATCLFLGLAITRIGNYINGEFYGLPTGFDWGVVFEYGPAGYEFPGTPLHPVMIYLGVLELAAFVSIYNLRKFKFKPGFLACVFLFLYSFIHFTIGFLRADNLYFFDVNPDRIFSVIGIIISAFLIIGFQLYHRPSKYRVKEYVPTRRWRF